MPRTRTLEKKEQRFSGDGTRGPGQRDGRMRMPVNQTNHRSQEDHGTSDRPELYKKSRLGDGFEPAIKDGGEPTELGQLESKVRQLAFDSSDPDITW